MLDAANIGITTSVFRSTLRRKTAKDSSAAGQLGKQIASVVWCRPRTSVTFSVIITAEQGFLQSSNNQCRDSPSALQSIGQNSQSASTSRSNAQLLVIVEIQDDHRRPPIYCQKNASASGTFSASATPGSRRRCFSRPAFKLLAIVYLRAHLSLTCCTPTWQSSLINLLRQLSRCFEVIR